MLTGFSGTVPRPLRALDVSSSSLLIDHLTKGSIAGVQGQGTRTVRHTAPIGMAPGVAERLYLVLRKIGDWA